MDRWCMTVIVLEGRRVPSFDAAVALNTSMRRWGATRPPTRSLSEGTRERLRGIVKPIDDLFQMRTQRCPLALGPGVSLRASVIFFRIDFSPWLTVKNTLRM